jgi:hypothetical protein
MTTREQLRQLFQDEMGTGVTWMPSEYSEDYVRWLEHRIELLQETTRKAVAMLENPTIVEAISKAQQNAQGVA